MSCSGRSGSDLCVTCGLCCDGTFLVRGYLFPDKEAQPLSFYKTEMEAEGDQHFFKLPCPHYEGGRCSIYESRFKVCRTYRCKLLARYEDGEIDLPEAQRTIALAKDLVATAAASDPDARIKSERIRLRSELDAELKRCSDAERPSVARRLLNMVAVDEFTKRWFHENQSNETEEPQAAGAEAQPTDRPPGSA